MCSEVPLNAVATIERFGQKLDGSLDPIVRFGARESQEPAAGRAKALAAQASDPELVVGRFEEVQGQALGRDAESVTDLGHVGEYVECAGGRYHAHVWNALQARREEFDFASKFCHRLV